MVGVEGIPLASPVVEVGVSVLRPSKARSAIRAMEGIGRNLAPTFLVSILRQASMPSATRPKMAGMTPNIRWPWGLGSMVNTAGRHIPITQMGKRAYSGLRQFRRAIKRPRAKKRARMGSKMGLPGRL